MYELSLDPNFSLPGFHKVKAEMLTFNGGEEHIKLSFGLTGERVLITHRLSGPKQIMQLAMAADAVRNSKNIPVLFIPYLPYARQDEIDPEEKIAEPLSIRVFVRMLEAIGYHGLSTYDVHSGVAKALLPRATFLTNRMFIVWVINTLPDLYRNNLTIVSPDAGAGKKVDKLTKRIEFKGDVAIGAKIRNVSTGEIIRQEVVGSVRDRHCLIIDDICDGGRTFIGLSQILRQQGALSVRLAVSHGIFSQGLAPLRPCFDEIYTTNSFRDYGEFSAVDFLKVYNLTCEG